MERHTFALKIHKGQLANYRRTLGENWTEIKSILDDYNINNFSLWAIDLFIFGYCETKEPLEVTKELNERLTALDKAFGDTYEWISKPFGPMRLMYHSYGGVQTCKELVYKKIFIAHLHEGMAEEYKKRHDAILPAPEDEYKHHTANNFTIWNAGDYIFGYLEIDATLERERTEDWKAQSTEWETHMLEIMDWVTNDVDWLTGEYHSNYRCIASYR